MNSQSAAEQPADIHAVRQQLDTLRQTVTAMEALLERYLTSEEALRQSEEQFRLLVTSVRDYAIFMLDPQGHIASWNIGAQLIKGYTADEIIGQHFSVFYPPADLAVGKPAWELEIAVREGMYHEEGWRVRKDGRLFWASVVITALFDDHGTLRGFGKVTRDLTDRKRADDALQQLRTQELELARAEAAREQAEANLRVRDEFVMVTAHELRTPVTAIRGYAELLRRRLDQGDITAERVVKPVQALVLQTKRLDRLTTMLLDVTRLEHGKLVLEQAPLDVRQAVEQVAQELQLLTERHQITLALPADPVIIIGDALRFEQAIYNLIQNAIKYSPAGGVIAVAVAVERSHALITVADVGVGIPSDELAHVFERFYRGTNVLSTLTGLGLGLALVQDIVARHHGTVEVRSRVGQGTTFRLRLPCAGRELQDPHGG